MTRQSFGSVSEDRRLALVSIDQLHRRLSVIGLLIIALTGLGCSGSSPAPVASPPLLGGRPLPATTPEKDAADLAARIREAQAHEAENKRREHAELEQLRLMATWGDQVQKLITDYKAGLPSAAGTLEEALLQAASKADLTRKPAVAERLREERNVFAMDRLEVPKSPEVLRAAHEYLAARLEFETESLAKLQTQAEITGVDLSSFYGRELNEAIAMAMAAVARLQAVAKRLDQITVADAPAGEKKTNNTGTRSSEQKTAQPSGITKSEGGGITPPVRNESPAATAERRPVANWKVTVDAGIAANAAPIKTGLEFKIPGRGFESRKMIYARGAATFAAAGTGSLQRTERYIVYNVRTGRETGLAGGMTDEPDATMLRGPALSPDGKLFALLDFQKQAILVGDVTVKKLVATIPMTDTGDGLLFANASRLLALEYGAGKPIHVIKLPKGTLERQIIPTAEIDGDYGRIACSPGGKFLACVGRDAPHEIRIYDLETGKVAGMVDSQALPQFVNSRITMVSFSPDGKELAALATGTLQSASIEQRLIVWEADTGNIVDQPQLGKIAYGEGQGLGVVLCIGPEPLQWFPDKKGWLLGHRFILERATSTILRDLIVDTTAGSDTYTSTKVLDDGHFLILQGDSTFKALKVPRTVEAARQR